MVAESTAIINNSKKNWSSDHIPKIEITLDPAIKKNSSIYDISPSVSKYQTKLPPLLPISITENRSKNFQFSKMINLQ